MIQSTKPISRLRQRFIEDMTLRKLAPKTQTAYIRAVVNFTLFLGRSPDTAEAEDLAPRWLVVPGTKPGEPHVDAATQPGVPLRVLGC